MEEHNAMSSVPSGIPADPAALELETVCNAIPAAVERAGRSLEEQYYVRLAEEALGPKWPNGEPPAESRLLLDAAQGELDHLHQTAKALAQSYQSVVGLDRKSVV